MTKYRSLFPHVSAPLQLTEAGISLVRGDTIQYIYTDAAYKNPLRRVMPLDFVSEENDYDKEKYPGPSHHEKTEIWYHHKY